MNTSQSSIPEMIFIPEGNITRGSAASERMAFPDEYTNNRIVKVRSFHVSKFPITNHNYREFIQKGGYEDFVWWDSEGWDWVKNKNSRGGILIDYWIRYILWLGEQDLQSLSRERNWRQERLNMYKNLSTLSIQELNIKTSEIFSRTNAEPAFWNNKLFNQFNQPVVGINWYEANAYCKWLSSVTNKGFRLLQEIEWEYAARGTDARTWPWGNIFDPLTCNTLESSYYGTTIVDKYNGGVSPFGVYDMSGNVWEWTCDLYKLYSGNQRSRNEFKDNLPEQLTQKLFVVRGGSWDNSYRYARCACRDKDVVEIFANRLGFRVAY